MFYVVRRRYGIRSIRWTRNSIIYYSYYFFPSFSTLLCISPHVMVHLSWMWHCRHLLITITDREKTSRNIYYMCAIGTLSDKLIVLRAQAIESIVFNWIFHLEMSEKYPCAVLHMQFKWINARIPLCVEFTRTSCSPSMHSRFGMPYTWNWWIFMAFNLWRCGYRFDILLFHFAYDHDHM